MTNTKPNNTNNIEIIDVWVAWSNSDLTEGRGRPIPLHTCSTETTAIRLGEKKSVQGSNCDVRKGIAFRVKNTTYVLGRIEQSSKIDDIHEENKTARNKAIERAKKAGLNNTDIETLLQG